MFKWFWTIFSLGAPVIFGILRHWQSTALKWTEGHFACACLHPLNDNSVGASNLVAGNRKLARKVTVLSKAISLVLWMPYFPTRNVLHDKNQAFSTRVSSCRFFSRRFSWPFKDKTRRQKSLFLYQIRVSLAKQCISMVWFSNSWFYLSRKKCTVAMFSYFKKSEKKKFTTRGLFISAMSHVKLIAETRVFICHKNMKSMDIFLQFFKRFRGKIYKKHSTGNEGWISWIESQTSTIAIDYVLHNSGGSRPSDKGGRGGRGSPKKFFRPFRPQFGLKIRGRGPLP